jgi:hypothetical protein
LVLAQDSFEGIEELKREIGSRVFAAQYQQTPTPPDGNMIKASWLGRYNTVPDGKNFQRVVLSCDPAGKAGIRNDYTAMTVIGLDQRRRVCWVRDFARTRSTRQSRSAPG